MENDAVDFFRFSVTEELTMLARVVVAGLAGAIVGWERKTTGHRAGVRTLTLVAIGAGVFTVASIFGFREGASADPSRLAAQVATGVGFLGAGTIVLLDRTLRGLTTAAAIWVVAALGIAAGAGLYILAIGAALLTTAVLTFLPHSDPDDVESSRDYANASERDEE